MISCRKLSKGQEASEASQTGSNQGKDRGFSMQTKHKLLKERMTRSQLRCKEFSCNHYHLTLLLHMVALRLAIRLLVQCTAVETDREDEISP